MLELKYLKFCHIFQLISLTSEGKHADPNYSHPRRNRCVLWGPPGWGVVVELWNVEAHIIEM